MPIRNTFTSYGSVSKFFHWTLFILIASMLIFGFLLSYVPKEYQSIAYSTHKLTGLCILTLMILRLLWTLTNPKPALPPSTPWYEYLAERLVHWTMYAALIVMPLSGWIGSVAANRSPRLGEYIFTLPIEQSKSLMTSSFEVHYTIALIIIGLVSVHILAALFHHFIRKDNVLRRMLPGKSEY